MSADLTLPSARAERDALANRTDVLRRIRAFCALPEDTHITTDLVARFYGAGVEAIKSLVKDNRSELESDGYRVLNRAEFAGSSGDLSNLDPKARQIAVFPLRAVLRVGMLLRDSEVARELRTLLLDTFEESTPKLPVDITTPEGIAWMASLFHDTANKLVVATKQLETAAPKARKYDNFLSADGDYDVNETAKVLQRAGIETGEKRLFESLRLIRWIYRDHRGRPRAYQSALDSGYLREKPQGQYVDDDGQVVLRTPQVRVTPKGIDKLIEKMRGAA
jgi:phage antirepressor YoqD-like protein